MLKDLIHDAMRLRDPSSVHEALEQLDIQLRLSENARDKADLLLGKVVLYGVLHSFSNARDHLRLALQCAPDDHELRLKCDFISASLFDEEGNPGEAVSQLTAVLENYSETLRRPDLRLMYEDIQQRRAFDLTRLQEFQEAVPVLNECLSFNLPLENRGEILVNLGECHLEMKEYELAASYLVQATRTGLSGNWQHYLHFYLGIAYAHLERYEESKREFLACEDQTAERPFSLIDIYKWLSYVCRRLGDTSESKKYAALQRTM